MDAEDATPDWDMTPYFPAFGEEAYCTFRDRVDSDVSTLGREVEGLGSPNGPGADDWVGFLVRLEDVAARLAHLSGYLGCLAAANARDAAVQQAVAAASAARAELETVFVQVRARLGSATVEEFTALRDRMPGAEHFLDRLRERARRSMAPELEALATVLGVTGLGAWARLYSRVAGTLEFDLVRPGEPSRRLPVSMVRSLLEDADASVRRAALRGANSAWQGVGDVMAASLNGIAGTRLALYRRRGIPHYLEPALFDQGIERETLDALHAAVDDRAEVARRSLRRKAELLGVPGLGFQDVMAPLPLAEHERIDWPAARARVLASFADAYPDLAAFAKRAFDSRWIDHAPRPGKAPGGFCSSSPLIGESRIFMTFNGATGDVATLAHELGHAWHGWLLRDARFWARHYPMTLAETASTFAQQIVIDAVLDDPQARPEARALMLDARMQDAETFLLNIRMRFLFECALYDERASGELSVERLCELMVEAQQRTYGDTLDPQQLDPWFWASKLHFYISGLSFYNFPYTFGYLFSLGLVARARAEGPGFLPRYEELLRQTGRGPVEQVVSSCLGIDLRGPDFWHGSIDLIEQDLGRWVAAVEALGL